MLKIFEPGGNEKNFDDTEKFMRNFLICIFHQIYIRNKFRDETVHVVHR